MTEILKLDFNERSDRVNPLTKDYSFGESLWQYPDRQPLENRIAELFELSPQQVLCTNGGDEAIMILMRMIKEASKMILPLPAFSQYTWGVKSWQQEAILVNANQYLGIDIEETSRAILENPKAVTILTRPNNPTGESIKLEDLQKLIEHSKSVGGWVFLDEAYIEFAGFESAAFSLLRRFDNLVILRTLSKAYGLAGIRLGYILGSEELIAQFRIRCMPFNISGPNLNIAMAAFEQSNQTEMKDYCDAIRNNRNFLSDLLTENGVEVFPSQANFLLMRFNQNQAKAIQSFLKKNGILVRAFNENELKGCLRITIPYQIEKLQNLLLQCIQPSLICMDMDGVLIDTSESYDLTVIETVKQLSGETVSLGQIEQLRCQGGYNNDWVLSRALLEQLGSEQTLEDVTQVFQKIYLGDDQNGLMANESVLISSQLVERINTEESINFSIVTGRPRKEALTGQSMVGLAKLELISLCDVEQAKPSPEGIQNLQRLFGLTSWMCGDNPDDMQAAVASNSLAIGIGTNKIDSLYAAGADIVLNDINELEQWL
jgi:histidinol-phosphate aminotransferase